MLRTHFFGSLTLTVKEEKNFTPEVTDYWGAFERLEEHISRRLHDFLHPAALSAMIKFFAAATNDSHLRHVSSCRFKRRPDATFDFFNLLHGKEQESLSSALIARPLQVLPLFLWNSMVGTALQLEADPKQGFVKITRPSTYFEGASEEDEPYPSLEIDFHLHKRSQPTLN